MEPKNHDGLNAGFELDIQVEELEQKNAPGDLVWPFPGGGGWGR